MSTTILPHDPLTPLDPNVDPTPAAVRLLREEMYANARSMKTSYGGGKYGHLGQLLPADRYLAFAGTRYTLSDQAPVFIPPAPLILEASLDSEGLHFLSGSILLCTKNDFVLAAPSRSFAGIQECSPDLLFRPSKLSSNHVMGTTHSWGSIFKDAVVYSQHFLGYCEDNPASLGF
jgi:hypothetical protein